MHIVSIANGDHNDIENKTPYHETDIRSDPKKSLHTFLCISQIWIAFVKNHSN